MGKYYKGIYNCKEYTTGENRFDVYENDDDSGNRPNVNMGFWIQAGVALGAIGITGGIMYLILRKSK